MQNRRAEGKTNGSRTPASVRPIFSWSVSSSAKRLPNSGTEAGGTRTPETSLKGTGEAAGLPAALSFLRLCSLLLFRLGLLSRRPIFLHTQADCPPRRSGPPRWLALRVHKLGEGRRYCRRRLRPSGALVCRALYAGEHLTDRFNLPLKLLDPRFRTTLRQFVNLHYVTTH